MKKTIIFLLLFVIILGLVYYYYRMTSFYPKPSPPVNRGSDSDCIILRHIQGNTPLERGRWLRNQNIVFNDAFYTCVSKKHEIPSDYFYQCVDADWKEQSFWDIINPFFKKYTKIRFSEIENINNCGCYNAFIALTTAKLNEIKPSSVEDFTINPTCYTLPLFRGVRLVNGLSLDDEIEFVHTKFTNEYGEVKKGIFFRVYNKTKKVYLFYNISDDPGHGYLGI